MQQQQNAAGGTGIAIYVGASPPAARTTLPNFGSVPFLRRALPFDVIENALANPNRTAVVVLFGQPGVGKTRIAVEYAKLSLDIYSGGVWFVRFDSLPPVDLIEILRLVGAPEYDREPLDQQCRRALRSLGTEPTLLIYDGVSSERDLEAWLPAEGAKCHVIATSTSSNWSMSHASCNVSPLSLQESNALAVKLLVEPDLVRLYAADLARRASGLPVQLCADARAVVRTAFRGRDPVFEPLAENTRASFNAAWRLLPPDAQMFLRVAALFEGSRIPVEGVLELLQSEGWPHLRFVQALDDVVDRCMVVSADDDLHIHALLRTFVLGQSAPELSTTLLDHYRQSAERAVRAAAATPTVAKLASRVLAYGGADQWDRFAEMVGQRAGDVAHAHADALLRSRNLRGAQEWFERAVVAKEKGDQYRHVDHRSLGTSLHMVGQTLVHHGRYTEARQWFERAVVARQLAQQSPAGRRALAVSLHQVGYCCYKAGKFGDAQLWLEQAIAVHEATDGPSTVDDCRELGTTMNLLGECLDLLKRPSDARLWLKRAIEVRRPLLSSIDPNQVAAARFENGRSLSMMKDYAAARDAFEESFSGYLGQDPHAPRNFPALGASLHGVGNCLFDMGRFAEAYTWFERAVHAKEKGDKNGLVDHESVGASLHMAASCLAKQGKVDKARKLFTQAASSKKRGDIYGHVDEASVAASVRRRERPGYRKDRRRRDRT